jgi:MoaA/NifB/PqqE/SkfB family radical SAM enzyme
MAEAEEERGTAQDGIGADGARARSDPENGRTGVRKRLKKAAEKTLDENMPKIMNCLLTNIDQNHLPSAKMLIDLADGPGDEEEFSSEAYLSLAEVLWKELKPGNRE